MTYTIAYLYYDLLNLYGDNGNIKALYYHLKEQGIKVNIKYLSIDDKKDFSKYDLVYIGSGTENNEKIALNDLIKYKKEIKLEINNNKNFFITGNSIELFGKYIRKNNEEINCLDSLDFYTVYNKNRIVKDVKYDNIFTKNKIIGFENHYGTINSKENKLFYNEGIIKNNFFATYIIGPILIRNPEFCNYYIKKIIKDKDRDFIFKKTDYKYEKLAYKENIESIN